MLGLLCIGAACYLLCRKKTDPDATRNARSAPYMISQSGLRSEFRNGRGMEIRKPYRSYQFRIRSPATQAKHCITSGGQRRCFEES